MDLLGPAPALWVTLHQHWDHSAVWVVPGGHNTSPGKEHNISVVPILLINTPCTSYLQVVPTSALCDSSLTIATSGILAMSHHQSSCCCKAGDSIGLFVSPKCWYLKDILPHWFWLEFSLTVLRADLMSVLQFNVNWLTRKQKKIVK